MDTVVFYKKEKKRKPVICLVEALYEEVEGVPL